MLNMFLTGGKLWLRKEGDEDEGFIWPATGKSIWKGLARVLVAAVNYRR